MKEKNKFKIGKILLILAIISFLIATIEGFLFYTHQNQFFRFLMIIENSINAFGFKPSISLNDAMELMQTENTVIHSVVGYAYGFAVFTAPYCTLSFVYKILERLTRFIFRFRNKKFDNNILIFGYNDEVKELLKNYDVKAEKKMCIHIFCSEKISMDESYSLSQKGIKTHSIDMLKASEDEFSYLLNKIGAKNATNIILFDNSSIKNFSLLQMFRLNPDDSGKVVLESGAKISCRCDNEAIKNLIIDYYDSKKGEQACYDLEIISIPELQVRKMYSDTPLHSYYLEKDMKLSDWNTRLLIVGFGKLGQQALLQAMNLGVVHSENPVTVDVFDTDIDNKSEIFANHFSYDTFDFDNRCIRLKKEVADGELVINFHNVNVNYKEFMDIIRKNSEVSPYTYVVVAIDDVNIAVNSAMKLGNYFDGCGHTGVPIIVRMDSDRRLAKYINTDDNSFAGVRIIDDTSSILSLDMILNETIDTKAKEFNHTYNNIKIVSRDSKNKKNNDSKSSDSKAIIEKEWNSISLYKRSSSKAAAYHEDVKQVILHKLAEENSVQLDERIDKLVGVNGCLFRYNGSAWEMSGFEEDCADAIKKDDFAYSVASLEHRRWCYYMASAGWRKGERNERLKQNPCMVTQDELIRTNYDMCKYDLMSIMAYYNEKIWKNNKENENV